MKTNAVIAHPPDIIDTWFQTRWVPLLWLQVWVTLPLLLGKLSAACGYTREAPARGKGSLFGICRNALQSVFFHSVNQCFQWRTQSYSLGLLSKLVKSHLLWQNTAFAPTVILVSSVWTSILSVFLIIYSWGYFPVPGPIGNSKELVCPVWLITRFTSQKWIIGEIKQFCIPSVTI